MRSFFTGVLRTITTKKWMAFIAMVLILGGASFSLFMTQANDRPARVIEICSNAGNKPLCYAEQIETILRTSGIPAAFDALAVAYDTDPAFAGTCHDVTHELGKVAYEEFHNTGTTELTSKAWYCGYGFYHGFMDALYVDTNDMEGARTFCTYVGENVPHPPPPQFAEGSCYHGIGHGITDGTDPRLWGDAIAILRPGLDVCNKVAAGNEQWLMRCDSGVFNALGNMYPNPKYKLDPGTNPYELCRTGPFTPLERETCYSQMNTQAAVLGHKKLDEIVAFGNTIQNLTYRAVAIHEAVSFYIQTLAWKQKSLQPEEMSVCNLATQELLDSCVSGLVGGMMEFGSPGQQYVDILRVCSADTLPENMRRSCFDSLQQNSQYYYSPNVFNTVCVEVPNEYRSQTCQL